jgi:hypothetical protein
MDCERCHKPLTDPRSCRHCGMAQSAAPAEPEAAAVPATPAEVCEVVQDAAARVVPDVPAEERRRAAAEARIQVKAVPEETAPAAAEAPEPPPGPPLETPAAEEPGPDEPEKPAAAAPGPILRPEPPNPQRDRKPVQRRPVGQEPRKDRGPVEVEISNSRLERFNAIHGDRNLLANINVSVGEKDTAPAASEPSVFDCLTPLPDLGMTDPGTTAFLREDLRTRAAALKKDRVLLITCPNDSFLRAAAAAVIETAAIAGADRRLLNFMRSGARGFLPTILHFLATRPDPRTEMVVVVDAAGDKARQFVESLFAVEGVLGYSDIGNSLSEQKLSLICLIDPTHFGKLPARDLKRFPFECWEVSYVRYLLYPHYPDDYRQLELTIEEQRKRGRWASSDLDFHEQIRDYIAGDRLTTVVEAGGVAVSTHTPEFFPAAGQPIHLAVAYTATFFPNLAPADFSRVVALLLGKRARTESVLVDRRGKDGVIEQVETQREKALVDIWRDDADTILAECRLVTNKEASRSVTFAVAGLRDRFRAHMESFWGLYLQNQFQTILEKSLVLDPSDRVAEDVRLLTVDMILVYPEQFNQAWFSDLIAFLGNSASAANQGAGPDSEHAFRRIAQLLGDVWSAQLDSLVHGALRDVIESGFHETAFAILTNLRFKPNVFEYIRQLVERSAGPVRDKIAAYLARELRQPGYLFSILRAIESWLPPTDREGARYSKANTLALRLALDYFVETTTRCELADYGKWPTTFPLLDVATAEKAKEEFALLARWLFNPGLQTAFEVPSMAENMTRFIAALVSEWAFILIGPPARAATAPDAAVTAAFSAEDALAMLLGQITTRAEAAHRSLLREMVAYWEQLDELLLAIANSINDAAVRPEVIWKRRIVRKLLGHVRDLQRSRRIAPPERAATA